MTTESGWIRSTGSQEWKQTETPCTQAAGAIGATAGGARAPLCGRRAGPICRTEHAPTHHSPLTFTAHAVSALRVCLSRQVATGTFASDPARRPPLAASDLVLSRPGRLETALQRRQPREPLSDAATKARRPAKYAALSGALQTTRAPRARIGGLIGEIFAIANRRGGGSWA